MMVFEWQADEALLTRTFLKHRGISRRLLSRIKFHGGQILVNGQEENVRHQLTVGDKVTVILPNELALKMDGAQAYYQYLAARVETMP